jgi:glyoxylase-like metal-dependent hydrolase (beta-lactamase superfamily II)
MEIIKLSLPPLSTNCYIVYENVGGECIIIDPASDCEKIKEAIDRESLTPTLIYLTHAHFDHIGAVDELRKLYHIPACIHEGDGEMMVTPEFNASSRWTERISPLPADKLLTDGDTINVGSMAFTVLHTPGHSKGSSVLFGEGVLFSGDTIFLNCYGRYDLYGGDLSELKTSLSKVLALDPATEIYPGHGRKTTIENERNFYGV